MSVVDLLIVAMAAAGAAHGVLLGAAIQVTSFGGTIAGLALGAALAPAAAGLTDDRRAQALLVLATVLGAASLLGGAGRLIGARVWGTLRRLRLHRVDAVLGAVVGVAAVLVGAWLVAAMLATVPSRPVAVAINRSAILRAVDSVMPEPPAVFARIQSFLDATGLPPVFAGIGGAAADLPADARSPDVAAALATAGRSTVRIAGPGCGGVQLGSGFVAATGFVVTNAHVLAGVDEPVVQVAGRTLPATTVLFDPDLDIAVLHAPDLRAPALALSPSEVGRGAAGAVLGYPGGGGLQGIGAVVLRQVDALGRDIYSRNLVRRPVYELQATVRSGNSGGPLVAADGTVLGVVFSRSAWQDDVGYAITSPAVVGHVRQARERTAPVDTGPCA